MFAPVSGVSCVGHGVAEPGESSGSSGPVGGEKFYYCMMKQFPSICGLVIPDDIVVRSPDDIVVKSALWGGKHGAYSEDVGQFGQA